MTEAELPCEEVENDSEPDELAGFQKPTQRYAPKPKRVIIPYVTPWENRPALQSQKGMGAFGRIKDAVGRVDEGEHPLKQGALHSATVLTRFNRDHECCASQRGQSGFGARRGNVSAPVDSKPMDHEKLCDTNCVLPMQSGTNKLATQSGMNLGNHRPQTPRIKYRSDMTSSYTPDSDTFVSRMFAANANSKAGSAVLDQRRPADMMHSVTHGHLGGAKGSRHSRAAEAIVPRLWDVSGLPPPPAVHQRRQVVTDVAVPEHSTVFYQTYDETKACMNAVPFAMAPALTTQSGMGAYARRRDVPSTVRYDFDTVTDIRQLHDDAYDNEHYEGHERGTGPK